MLLPGGSGLTRWRASPPLVKHLQPFIRDHPGKAATNVSSRYRFVALQRGRAPQSPYGSHRRLRADRRHARPPRWSAATARSTGCACRASTPPPASPRCSATPTHGRWLIAPQRRSLASQPRATAANSLVLETEFTTDDRRRARWSTACRRASGRPIWCGSSRACAARSRCGWSWCVRFDYGSIVPWVRSDDGGVAGDRRAGCAVAAGRTVADPRRGPDHHGRVHGRARASSVAVRADVAPLARAGPRRSTPLQARRATPSAWWELVRAVHLPGRVARRRRCAR